MEVFEDVVPSFVHWILQEDSLLVYDNHFECISWVLVSSISVYGYAMFLAIILHII